MLAIFLLKVGWEGSDHANVKASLRSLSRAINGLHVNLSMRAFQVMSQTTAVELIINTHTESAFAVVTLEDIAKVFVGV